MAQRFIDSFDHYSASQIAKKWTNATGGTAPQFVTGRTGNGLQLTNYTLEKTLDYQSEWFVGFAFKVTAGTNNFFGHLYQLYSNNNIMLTLECHNDGTLGISTGFNELSLGNPPSTFAMHTDTWYYCEIHSSFGADGAGLINVDVEVRINTAVVISLSSVNVGHHITDLLCQSAKANFHWFSALSNGGVVFDDLYINDANGGINDGYYGDVRIGCIYPNGDVLIPWNATGTPHYQQVNEHSPDDDATTISSATPGAIEVLDWEDIVTFDGTVKGVQFLIYAKKGGEGTRTIAHVTGDTGVESTGPDQYLSDDYLYYIKEYDQDPNGPIDWTQVNFNAKRFGVSLTS
jgi:hypothetical protein